MVGSQAPLMTSGSCSLHRIAPCHGADGGDLIGELVESLRRQLVGVYQHGPYRSAGGVEQVELNGKARCSRAHVLHYTGQRHLVVGVSGEPLSLIHISEPT